MAKKIIKPFPKPNPGTLRATMGGKGLIGIETGI